MENHGRHSVKKRVGDLKSQFDHVGFGLGPE